MKFVPMVPTYNIPALVQIMDWGCPGDKPLSELMMVSLPMHLYASLSLDQLMHKKTYDIWTQQGFFIWNQLIKNVFFISGKSNNSIE